MQRAQPPIGNLLTIPKTALKFRLNNWGNNMRSKNAGFTLIELMVVVAIIAIIAVLALPSYRDYVLRSNRAAAQAQMLDISNREQQYLLANRDYTNSLTTLNYTLPTDVDNNYNAAISLDCDANGTTDTSEGKPPCFIITFTATGDQAKDGTLVLSSTGTKTRAGDASKWDR